MPACWSVVRTWGGVVLAAMALSACVSVPKVEADKSRLSTVKKVALLEVAAPKRVVVANQGGAAGAFGLIGAAIQGSTNENNTKRFAAELNSRNVPVAATLRSTLEAELRKAGYQVVHLQGQGPKLAADGKSDDYSGVTTDADAILHVWFTAFGYVSPPHSTDYLPYMITRARLLDARTKSDLYLKTFGTGQAENLENVVAIPAPPDAKYGSFDALMSGFTPASEALLTGVRQVGQRIGQDLRAN